MVAGDIESRLSSLAKHFEDASLEYGFIHNLDRNECLTFARRPADCAGTRKVSVFFYLDIKLIRKHKLFVIQRLGIFPLRFLRKVQICAL